MNAKILRKLDMFKRVIRFLAEYLITLPRAEATRLEIVAIIVALEAAARDQVGGAGESEGGADLREAIARDLREYLKAVNRTARTLETVNAGKRPTFRLPKSGSYPALIATAQTIIAAAEPMEAKFVEAGMSMNFLSELNGLLNSFKEASRRKISGKLARIQSTATLDIQARLGVIAATKLDACVRNYFRGKPEILAAWSHARHIQRAPARNRPTSTGSDSALREEEMSGTLDPMSVAANGSALPKEPPIGGHVSPGGVNDSPHIARRFTLPLEAPTHRNTDVRPPVGTRDQGETDAGELIDYSALPTH